ncbi:type II toxin-antitoxin system VapC family toxin [Modestobacter lapidis]|nr:type II toxin-antitoxin system VapC family toxin [Modestobacter lapidis]
MIAFDTSALVKLVLAEAESDVLDDWVTARPGQPWVASDLCRVEVIRAVARSSPGAVTGARQLLAGLDLVPLSQTLLDRAADLAPPSVRSLDAIHLATASTLGAALEAFVVYDHRLADAARAAGLPTAAPA